MKRALRAILLLAGIAAAANVLTVLVAPRAIHALVAHRIAARAAADGLAGVNRALPAPRADADSRTVVRPSPDLLYTACLFDVSQRPLHITGPIPHSYASLSGFAANTDNFFALSDAEVKGEPRRFNVVLALQPPTGVPPGARLVIAPSARGLILFRTLIPDEASLPALRVLQREQRCEPL